MVQDGYTLFGRVYLVKYKSVVTEYLKEYIIETETTHKEKLTKIRFDNDGEHTLQIVV